MALFIGNSTKEPSILYFGSNSIKEVYWGNTRVWLTSILPDTILQYGGVEIVTVNVSYTGEWLLERGNNTESFLFLPDYNKIGEILFSILFSANQSNEQRIATIIVHCGLISHTITIIQEPYLVS